MSSMDDIDAGLEELDAYLQDDDDDDDAQFVTPGKTHGTSEFGTPGELQPPESLSPPGAVPRFPDDRTPEVTSTGKTEVIGGSSSSTSPYPYGRHHVDQDHEVTGVQAEGSSSYEQDANGPRHGHHWRGEYNQVEKEDGQAAEELYGQAAEDYYSSRHEDSHDAYCSQGDGTIGTPGPAPSMPTIGPGPAPPFGATPSSLGDEGSPEREPRATPEMFPRARRFSDLDFPPLDLRNMHTVPADHNESPATQPASTNLTGRGSDAQDRLADVEAEVTTSCLYAGGPRSTTSSTGVGQDHEVVTQDVGCRTSCAEDTTSSDHVHDIDTSLQAHDHDHQHQPSSTQVVPPMNVVNLGGSARERSPEEQASDGEDSSPGGHSLDLSDDDEDEEAPTFTVAGDRRPTTAVNMDAEEATSSELRNPQEASAPSAAEEAVQQSDSNNMIAGRGPSTTETSSSSSARASVPRGGGDLDQDRSPQQQQLHGPLLEMDNATSSQHAPPVPCSPDERTKEGERTKEYYQQKPVYSPLTPAPPLPVGEETAGPSTTQIHHNNNASRERDDPEVVLASSTFNAMLEEEESAELLESPFDNFTPDDALALDQHRQNASSSSRAGGSGSTSSRAATRSAFSMQNPEAADPGGYCGEDVDPDLDDEAPQADEPRVSSDQDRSSQHQLEDTSSGGGTMVPYPGDRDVTAQEDEMAEPRTGEGPPPAEETSLQTDCEDEEPGTTAGETGSRCEDHDPQQLQEQEDPIDAALRKTIIAAPIVVPMIVPPSSTAASREQEQDHAEPPSSSSVSKDSAANVKHGDGAADIADGSTSAEDHPPPDQRPAHLALSQVVSQQHARDMPIPDSLSASLRDDAPTPGLQLVNEQASWNEHAEEVRNLRAALEESRREAQKYQRDAEDRAEELARALVQEEQVYQPSLARLETELKKARDGQQLYKEQAQLSLARMQEEITSLHAVIEDVRREAESARRDVQQREQGIEELRAKLQQECAQAVEQTRQAEQQRAEQTWGVEVQRLRNLLTETEQESAQAVERHRTELGEHARRNSEALEQQGQRQEQLRAELEARQQAQANEAQQQLREEALRSLAELEQRKNEGLAILQNERDALGNSLAETRFALDETQRQLALRCPPTAESETQADAPPQFGDEREENFKEDFMLLVRTDPGRLLRQYPDLEDGKMGGTYGVAVHYLLKEKETFLSHYEILDMLHHSLSAPSTSRQPSSSASFLASPEKTVGQTLARELQAVAMARGPEDDGETEPSLSMVDPIQAAEAVPDPDALWSEVLFFQERSIKSLLSRVRDLEVDKGLLERRANLGSDFTKLGKLHESERYVRDLLIQIRLLQEQLSRAATSSSSVENGEGLSSVIDHDSQQHNIAALGLSGLGGGSVVSSAPGGGNTASGGSPEVQLLGGASMVQRNSGHGSVGSSVVSSRAGSRSAVQNPSGSPFDSPPVPGSGGAKGAPSAGEIRLTTKAASNVLWRARMNRVLAENNQLVRRVSELEVTREKLELQTHALQQETKQTQAALSLKLRGNHVHGAAGGATGSSIAVNTSSLMHAGAASANAISSIPNHLQQHQGTDHSASTSSFLAPSGGGGISSGNYPAGLGSSASASSFYPPAGGSGQRPDGKKVYSFSTNAAIRFPNYRPTPRHGSSVTPPPVGQTTSIEERFDPGSIHRGPTSFAPQGPTRKEQPKMRKRPGGPLYQTVGR
ncbi:unnamed protein product [Amoebophrya sp. A25]|nr:unnamed protein product [Amoebophrya sp. A25]|eukprot:GSA25T00013276001.1